MERNVVEIYKGIDKETLAKVAKVKEETSAKLHEIAEEHHETMIKFAGGLSDEEFTALMKSEELDTADKVLVLTAYGENHVVEE